MKKLWLFICTLLFLLSCSGDVKPLENKWAEKENSNITSSETEEKVILALGDSLTAGYNLDIKDSFPLQLEALLKKNKYNYKIINAWVSWDTSKNLLDRIELYDELTPELILVSIGANNGLRKQSIEQMSSDINDILSHLKSTHSKSTIVLAWMQMPLNVWIEYATDFAKVFPDIAEKNTASFFPFLLQDVATIQDLNLSDGIHPNKKWYAIIANNLYNFLKENWLLE